MSDGVGGESSKEIESCLKKKRKKNDEYPQAISRIAVAQVCESLGFQGFQQSALDTFSDVACKYICELGKTSNFYANLAGRTECNVFDIIQGLEDLNLSQGFLGASDRDRCSSGSGIIKEISQYVSLSEEIAFAYSIPSLPVIKKPNSTPSFLQTGETPPTNIFSHWLPKFPDPETYTSIPLSTTEQAQTMPDRIDQKLPLSTTEQAQTMPDRIDQKQKLLEPQLSKLEQFWARNESEFHTVVSHGDNGRIEQPNNPFLAVPLQPGEKEISLISIPAKLKEIDTVQNHVSESNTSTQENKEVKNGGYDMEGSRKVVLNNRPTVQMKFQIGKKSLFTRNRHNDKGKAIVSLFVNDEKERRIEKLSIEENTG